jgi:hypothetical protein
MALLAHRDPDDDCQITPQVLVRFIVAMVSRFGSVTIWTISHGCSQAAWHGHHWEKISWPGYRGNLKSEFHWNRAG